MSGSLLSLLFPLSVSGVEGNIQKYLHQLLIILNQASQIAQESFPPALFGPNEEAKRQEWIHILHDRKFSLLRIIACAIIFARIKILPKITNRQHADDCCQFLDLLESHISPEQQHLFIQMGYRGELNSDVVIQQAQESMNIAKQQFLTNNL